MLKGTIWASERNKTLMIKSIVLNLALIIGEDFNPTALRENNVSRLYSPRVILVNHRMIIGKNLIQISGIKRHVFAITAAERAIFSAPIGRKSKSWN